MATLKLQIAIVRRAGDGLVQIAAVGDVPANLQLLQTFGVEIDAHTASAPTPHARAIVDELRRRFRRAAIDGGPWFAIDFFDAVAARREYNLRTGKRTAADAIRVKAEVFVEGMGYGTVKGFASCGRIEVSFPRLHCALTTLAPASQVHPV